MGHLISQVNLCVSLGHSDQRFNVTNSNWNTADDIRLSSNVRIEFDNLVLINLRQLWLVVSLGVDEVLLQKIKWHELALLFVLFLLVSVWQKSFFEILLMLLEFLFFLNLGLSLKVLILHFFSNFNDLWMVLNVRIDDECR